jgi:hypothetical protein
MIDHNLETTPLEIKTDSKLGSNERVYVWFYDARDANDNRAGGIDIRFNSRLQYRVPFCHSTDESRLNDFPDSLPTSTIRVWRVTLDKTSGITIRYKIHCNDVEVANVLLSDSECTGNDSWRDYYSRTQVKLQKEYSDTASDYFRPYIDIGK